MKQVASTSGGIWTAALTGFVATAIAARALGPTSFGEAVVAIGISAIAFGFLDVSLQEAVLHQGFGAREAGKTRRLQRIVSTALITDITVGAAILAGIWLGADAIVTLSGSATSSNSVRLAALIMAVKTADTTTAAVLLMDGRVGARAWSQALAGIIRTVGVAFLWSIDALDVSGLLLVFAGGNLLGSLTQAAIARVAWRRITSAIEVRESAESVDVDTSRTVLVGALLRFGFHTSLTKTFTEANSQILTVLAGGMFDSSTAGAYRIATLPITLAGTLSAPVRLVLVPDQAVLAASVSGRRSLRAHTRRVLSIAIASGVPGALLGWLAIPWLVVGLYSNEYGSAIEIARILLVTALAHWVTSWTKFVPAALGSPQTRTWITATELAITVLAGLVLSQQVGAHGLAWGAAFASAVAAAVWLVALRRLLQEFR